MPEIDILNHEGLVKNFRTSENGLFPKRADTERQINDSTKNEIMYADGV
jgi:hypothetical protein